MKKILFYTLLTSVAFTTVSCDEDFNEDVAAPQTWPQEEAITLPGFSATATSPVDLASGDSVAVFINNVPSALPEGTTVDRFRLEVTPDGVEGTKATTVNASANGKVASADLQKIIEDNYGKRPVERTLNAKLYANLMKDGQASLLTCDPIVIKATPKAPQISNHYYIIGAPSKWELTETSLPFTHSDKDVYEDPVFTIMFPVADGETWFAITDDVAVEKNDWAYVFGCVEGNGNNGIEGKLGRRSELSDDGSWKVVVDGDASFVKVVINMMEGTYSIQKIVPEYYIVGAMQGWSDSKKTCMLYPQGKMTYSYTTKFEGDGNLKLWLGSDFGSWDACYGAAVDGSDAASGALVGTGAGAAVCPEKGAFYTFTADFSTMTYVWTKLENQAPASYEKIGLIGDFNGWGGDFEMEQVTPHNWYAAGLTVEVEGGIKFRANAGWDVNWGVGADLSHDLSVDNYGVGANGKGNLKIAAGVYNVFFNDITGEFVFVAVE